MSPTARADGMMRRFPQSGCSRKTLQSESCAFFPSGAAIDNELHNCMAGGVADSGCEPLHISWASDLSGSDYQVYYYMGERPKLGRETENRDV